MKSARCERVKRYVEQHPLQVHYINALLRRKHAKGLRGIDKWWRARQKLIRKNKKRGVLGYETNNA